MMVNEIFYSLQGEGFLAGIPSVFIRLAGCPLQCRWCDSRYAWAETAGRQMALDDIVDQVTARSATHVVITGGEPMLADELPQLTAALRKLPVHITIETAGIVHNPAVICDVMSISPKLANSSPLDARNDTPETTHLDISVLQLLTDSYEYQFKFVVESPDDLDEIERLLADIGQVDRRKVMLMPQAATRDQLIRTSPMVVELCKKARLAFSPRLQVMLWDNQRGV